MSNSEWLEYRLDQQRRSSVALAAAADQANTCRDIEEALHRQGRDHVADRRWLKAVGELQRRVEEAASHGFDGQAIRDEAARRRT